VWAFYLAASEMAFREQAVMVMQIQIAKRQDVVPVTRDYIAREETRCPSSRAASARRCDSPANNPAPSICCRRFGQARRVGSQFSAHPGGG